MPLPTFLIIGAAKSGTTSLYEYLSQHPGVFMSEIKEPKFFAWDAERPSARLWESYPVQPHPVCDIDAYRALFAGAREGQAIGEASVIYLESLFAPERIRAELPDAKLIVSLRQPADRAYSDYLMAVRRGSKSGLEEAMAPDEHRVLVGFYHRLLTRYYDLFPRENIKVLIFEEWRDQPQRAITEMCEFLGVDGSFQPNLKRRHNVGGLPRRKWLHQLLLRRTPLRRRILEYTPKPVRRLGRWLYYSNLQHPGPMPVELRKELTERYRPDILELQKLLGKDLSAWLA